KHFGLAYEGLPDHYCGRKDEAKVMETLSRALKVVPDFYRRSLKKKTAHELAAWRDKKNANGLLVEVFKQTFGLDEYLQIKRISSDGQWAERKAELIALVEKAGQQEALARIFAAEKDRESLKTLLAKLTENDDEELRIIQKALRKEDPEASAEALKLLATGCLRHTGRDYYRMAADYLGQAKQILVKSGKKTDGLEKFIGTIREEYRHRPALQKKLKWL
ncbi:hypothetical protein COT30_01995, partial [Candidatus Micrarchaeota archaeon CG08_land_8_20_14_0_20_49_17]